jgi:uncharacterized protein (DUF2336 family)
MQSAANSGIAGLIELARRESAELMPALLRVLTDLYVQGTDHTAEERARFAELATRLLDRADKPTRAGVALRLARYPATPAAVASKLARDEIAVAEPVLRYSPVLSAAELHAVLDRCGIAHAIAIAARAELPRSVAERLRETGQRREEPDAIAEKTPALTIALARRYLRSNSDERRLIVAAVAACPPSAQEEALRRLGRGFNEQLERAALRHRLQEFAVALQRQAGIPFPTTEMIVADASGEPLALLCRALGMPFAMASRVLLFLNPAVGASAQQVFNLASHFEETDTAAARRIAGAWPLLYPRMKHLPIVPTDARTQRGNERGEAARSERPAPRLSYRGVTPARPAAAGEF